MSSRLFAWAMLTVWASWLTAAQGLLAARPQLAEWIPDASLVMLISCATFLPPPAVVRAVLLLALARASYSIDPPAAILAGFFSIGMLVRGAKSVVEFEGLISRTLFTFVAAWSFNVWLQLVHYARDGRRGPLDELLQAALQSWTMAAATAGFALLFGGSFRYLPGLSPLRRWEW